VLRGLGSVCANVWGFGPCTASSTLGTGLVEQMGVYNIKLLLEICLSRSAAIASIKTCQSRGYNKGAGLERPDLICEFWSRSSVR